MAERRSAEILPAIASSTSASAFEAQGTHLSIGAARRSPGTVGPFIGRLFQGPDTWHNLLMKLCY